jgi:shikimate kinase
MAAGLINGTVMSTDPNIYLVGPMGSGKSAVGRRLAKDLGREFFDSDAVVEARTGVDIAFIFEKEGESGFRRREQAVIEELTGCSNAVLATGGGAILAAPTRRLLDSGGTVIYLHATVKQQFARTRRGKRRPLLQSGDRLQILEDLMRVRDPLYRSIADFVIETDGRTVADVTGEIRKKLAGS